MHEQLGQTMDRRCRKAKEIQLPFLNNWELKQGPVHTPALNTIREVCKPPKSPLQPNRWTCMQLFLVPYNFVFCGSRRCLSRC